MTNAASSSNTIIESVVGFSNDSRGENSGQGLSSYVPGAPSSPTSTSRSATVFVHGGVDSPAPAPANAPGRAAVSEDLGEPRGASGGKDREASGGSGRKHARTARSMAEVPGEANRVEKESFSAEELQSSDDEGSTSGVSNP